MSLTTAQARTIGAAGATRALSENMTKTWSKMHLHPIPSQFTRVTQCNCALKQTNLLSSICWPAVAPRVCGTGCPNSTCWSSTRQGEMTLPLSAVTSSCHLILELLAHAMPCFSAPCRSGSAAAAAVMLIALGLAAATHTREGLAAQQTPTTRSISWWWAAPRAVDDPAVQGLVDFCRAHKDIVTTVIMRCGIVTCCRAGGELTNLVVVSDG